MASYLGLRMPVHFHKKLLTTQGSGVAIVAGCIYQNAWLVGQCIQVILQVGRIESLFFRFHQSVVIPELGAVFPEDVVVFIAGQVLRIGCQEALDARRYGAGRLCIAL